LRISGTSQIKEAIEKIFSKEYDSYYLVVFSEEALDLEGFRDVVKQICDLDAVECSIDLNRVKNTYNITENEINSAKRSDETDIEILKKLILERIALSIFK